MTNRQIGEVYSSKHTEYSEATQYCYYNGVHDLALFWARPTLKEINGFNNQPIEIALHVEQSILFLLYRIVDICEWSDVAYNIHQLQATEITVPTDSPGSHAKLQMTLVNAGNGIIVAKRTLSISPVMTQALRHTLQEQLQTPISRSQYEAQVRQAYARHPDSDSMLKEAWMTETVGPDAKIKHIEL
jgi:hypothetical protein